MARGSFQVFAKTFSSFYKFFCDNIIHTVLIQPTSRPESWTYSDYETKDERMESVCKILLKNI